MNSKSIAPCGINCDICLGFMRKTNKCVGCNNEGNKPYHCTICSIRTCRDKGDDPLTLCNSCTMFPCRKIKVLDKRYRSKYGESPVENLITIGRMGIDAFINADEVKWKCPQCGELLCVHRAICLKCGAVNNKYPQENG